MNESLLFWAKLGTHEWPTEYHPLVCHLIDVGQVAFRLWNDVSGSRIKQWVVRKLGFSDEETAAAWLAFWVTAHDIGKTSRIL